MSDDIVARLRAKYAAQLPICAESADEIERLRAEVSRLMQIICDSSPDDDYLLVRSESDAIWQRIHKDNQVMRDE